MRQSLRERLTELGEERTAVRVLTRQGFQFRGYVNEIGLDFITIGPKDMTEVGNVSTIALFHIETLNYARTGG